MNLRKENNIFPTILLFLIIFGVLLFIIFGLRAINLNVLPDFIENMLSGSNSPTETPTGDDGGIYAALNGGGNNGTYEVESDITEENVRKILESLKQPVLLNIEAVASYYSEDGYERRTSISLYKKNEKFRYTTMENGEEQNRYINDTEREYLRDSVLGTTKINPATENFSYDTMPYLPKISTYFDLFGEELEILECTIARSETENIIKIIFTSPPLNQKEEFYISLDLGIIMYMKSYLSDGKPIFEYSTKSLQYKFNIDNGAGFTISDSYFEIPA